MCWAGLRKGRGGADDPPSVLTVTACGLAPFARRRMDVGDGLAAEQGEQGGSRRIAGRPQVLPQSLVELETVAGPRDQRALDHRRPAVVRVLRTQADSVAYPETLGVRKGDFLIVPVGIGGQLRRGARSMHRGQSCR